MNKNKTQLIRIPQDQKELIRWINQTEWNETRSNYMSPNQII